MSSPCVGFLVALCADERALAAVGHSSPPRRPWNLAQELQARIRDVEEVNREDARGLYEASAETVVPMPGENEPGESNLGDPRLDEARSEGKWSRTLSLRRALDPSLDYVYPWLPSAVSGVPGEALEVPGEQEVPEERVATPDELKPQEQGK